MLLLNERFEFLIVLVSVLLFGWYCSSSSSSCSFCSFLFLLLLILFLFITVLLLLSLSSSLYSSMLCCQSICCFLFLFLQWMAPESLLEKKYSSKVRTNNITTKEQHQCEFFVPCNDLCSHSRNMTPCLTFSCNL